eukprot:6644-Heterococcus_DN1.PRE.2
MLCVQDVGNNAVVVNRLQESVSKRVLCLREWRVRQRGGFLVYTYDCFLDLPLHLRCGTCSSSEETSISCMMNASVFAHERICAHDGRTSNSSTVKLSCKVERLYSNELATHEHSGNNDCTCTSRSPLYRFALKQSLATLQQRYCCMLLDIAAASSQLQTLLSSNAEIIEQQFHLQELRQGGQHKAANAINHDSQNFPLHPALAQVLTDPCAKA